MLFSTGAQQPSVLLIKRAETLSRHRGEWALPGGGAEKEDASLLDTALRETEEEIGIRRDNIEIWGPLDAVVTGTGYVVWPFGGLIPDDVPVEPDAGEVAEVVRMPLAVLVEQRFQRTITSLDGSNYKVSKALSFDGKIVWGATARMLFQVAEAMMHARSDSDFEPVINNAGNVVGGNGD